MPFDVNTFNARLLADNPSYSRIFKSDLDAVVKLVRSGGFSTNGLAAEMKKVSGEKWTKYSQTKAYLVSQFPLLEQAMRGTVVGFKTVSLMPNMAGIDHRFAFVSSTGDVNDLRHIKTREHVAWDAPPPAIVQYMNEEPGAVIYREAGNHYGQVLGDAWFPQHTDTHGSRAAFNDRGRNYSGEPLTLTFNQIYEFRVDGVWHTVPGSRFTLSRTLSSGGRIKMTKTSLDRPGETASSELVMG